MNDLLKSYCKDVLVPTVIIAIFLSFFIGADAFVLMAVVVIVLTIIALLLG